ncbi:MAG: methionine ABC transporter permease [Clostridium sp.]
MDNIGRVIGEILFPALCETIYMVIFATLYSAILGIVLGIILTVTDSDGLKPNKYIYKILDFIINILRSFPFVVLAIAIMPITKIVVGTRIGVNAALLPLVLVMAPFVGKMIEGDLKKVDIGMIEAAKSFGASKSQIIFKIMMKEALPSIILSITLIGVSMVGSSAMAGAVGAGGLGSVAIIYGYQSFNDFVMYGTVVIILILVQLVQSIGSFLYKKYK